jgi:hypothetical protein
VKFIILPLLIIFLPLLLLAQKERGYSLDTTKNGARLTPYDPQADYRTWSIKGKVLPFFLGNGGGLSALFGAEYGIATNQSIGIDGFFEYQENSDDNVQDTAGAEHSVGNYWHSSERAVFINYRYYFNFQRLRQKKGIAPYTVAFLRYGKLDQYYDPLYPLTSYYQNHEWDYSAGVLVGATFGSKRDKRFGLDVNTGVFEKEKVKDTEYLVHGVESEVHSRRTGLGFRLSVNLSWWFIHK